jgi:hypothetical protein
LANALNRASSLEAKLKATTKALGEADKKRDEEVVATKLAANQAVKEAEAGAMKSKKSLAEVPRGRRNAKKSLLDGLVVSVLFLLAFTIFVFRRPVFY